MLNKLIENFTRNFKLWNFLCFVFLILVVTPRFDQQNLGPVKKLAGNAGHLGEYSYDVFAYIESIKYFRGEESNPTTPFSYRTLPCYLASFLPFKEITSLNIINVFSLLLTLILIQLILKIYHFKKGVIIISELIYIFSFPVFYFGTSGHSDPIAILLIFLGVYSIAKKNFLISLIIVFISAFAKEICVILMPFYFLHNGINIKSFLRSLLMFLVFIIGTYFTRNIIEIGDNYTWIYEWETMISNLKRSRTYLSFILAYFIYGPLVLTYLFKYKTNQFKSYLISNFIALSIYIYAIIAAYPDSRFVWISYPFSLVLAAHVINQLHLNTLPQD